MKANELLTLKLNVMHMVDDLSMEDFTDLLFYVLRRKKCKESHCSTCPAGMKWVGGTYKCALLYASEMLTLWKRC